MKHAENVTLYWFRRDLRLEDNKGLYYALKEQTHVLPLFIFDTEILNQLEDPVDGRVEFIYNQLIRLRQELNNFQTSIRVLYGKPLEIFKKLLNDYRVEALYFNHDYEPYAKERDQQIRELLEGKGIPVKSFKDQVIFEKDEILKADQTPYTVFTPYKRKWLEAFDPAVLQAYDARSLAGNFYHTQRYSMPELGDMGFQTTSYAFPDATLDEQLIKQYESNRDYPALNGTTRLGVHFRHGTLSIRKAVAVARKLSPVWLSELIWREFYMMILWHFPHIVDQSFKPRYDFIDWRNNEAEFEKWCRGETGYPIVDAGMRELNETGYMHNRVRMITASFLTKHLLIDWRWGEAYFGKKLLDYELSSNNGGWQWAAGSGCDAAPYFRIFNPELQTKKFDPDHTYIKKWVPENQSIQYPRPLVEHKFARERALKEYKKALKTA